MKENSYISYSEILNKFIEPIVDGTESEEEYLLKAKAGIIAWNHHLSNSNKIPYSEEINAILNEVTKEHSEAKKIFNFLVLRKEAEFNNYNQILIKADIKTKADGSKSFYVESVPVDKLN